MHDLIRISEYEYHYPNNMGSDDKVIYLTKWPKHFSCRLCKAKLKQYHSDDDLVYQSINNNRLTCEEIIIKNIIE